MKIHDLSEKGVLFVAQIRGKGGCFLTLEHEYVPFLVQEGGLGSCYVRMFYARIDYKIFNINQYLGLMKFQRVRLHG